MKAMTIIAMGCDSLGSMIAAHELGHNLGISHAAQVDEGRDVELYKPYSRGFGEVGNFYTVMGYPGVFRGEDEPAKAIDQYSEAGKIIEGDEIGDEDTANAVVTAREIAPYIANALDYINNWED